MSSRRARFDSASIRRLAGCATDDIGLAARNVLRQHRRSAAALLSIAAGIAALIVAGGFIDWIYWSMREATIGSRLGHIQIVREGYLRSGAADPSKFVLPDDSVLMERISRLPGVLSLAPRIKLGGLVSHGETSVSFLGEGIDPTREASFDNYVLMVSGSRLDPSDPHGVIVGEGLARNLGIKPGDDVVLLVTKRSGGLNGVDAKVRGLFATATKAYDDVALRMPLATAQSLIGARGAHAWVVILDDSDKTDEITAKITRIVAGRGLDVVPWYRLADFYNKTVTLFSKQVGVLRAIIALIIVLGITNAQTMSVMERMHEIGTAMALGASRWRVLARFVWEAVVLGIVGGTIGVVAGTLLSALISAIGIPMPAPPGMTRGFVGEVRLTGGLVAGAFSLAIATTIVAGAYPAWRASRAVIVDALRTAH